MKTSHDVFIGHFSYLADWWTPTRSLWQHFKLTIYSLLNFDILAWLKVDIEIKSKRNKSLLPHLCSKQFKCKLSKLGKKGFSLTGRKTRVWKLISIYLISSTVLKEWWYCQNCSNCSKSSNTRYRTTTRASSHWQLQFLSLTQLFIHINILVNINV